MTVEIEEDGEGVWLIIKENGNLKVSYPFEIAELEPVLIAIEDYLEKE